MGFCSFINIKKGRRRNGILFSCSMQCYVSRFFVCKNFLTRSYKVLELEGAALQINDAELSFEFHFLFKVARSYTRNIRCYLLSVKFLCSNCVTTITNICLKNRSLDRIESTMMLSRLEDTIPKDYLSFHVKRMLSTYFLDFYKIQVAHNLLLCKN